MAKFINLTGQVFGRLTVLYRVDTPGTNRFKWHCRCECGNEIATRSSSLRGGLTQSCGCYKREVNAEVMATTGLLNTHGMTESVEYAAWANMKDRCGNPQHRQWPDYGGRGITVCDRWLHSFENFYQDMGPRPAGMSIDRIDNDSGYFPENCRWATKKQQGNNRRKTHLVSFAGKTQTIAQWADELGVKYETLRARLKRWPLEKALT